MKRLLIALVFFGALQAAAANASLWIAVGSFQDAGVAARVAKEASNKLDASFSVQQADTPNGIVQRVAAGPFASREEAQAAQERAKAGGYPDSWIFSRSTDDETVAASGALNPADESNLARVLNDDTANAATGNDLSTMENDLINQPQHQRTLQEALKQVKELPTEIPPGYRLNYLFRDGEPKPPDTDQ
jgi:hypothetical protein